MKKQVLPYFGSVPLNKITNAVVREWVSALLSSGLSAATTRKAVFALRQCLAAAIADERIQFNPACAVPLPTERQKPPRYLSQSEVERLVDQMPRQYRALVLVGAYAGLRWGEAAGFTQARHRPATLPHPRDVHGCPVARTGDLRQRAQDDALETFHPGRSLRHAAA
jgi:site-specific recombinase XerD